ncbi:MAG: hypothetical protein IJJ33_10690 [Victivallales bacterium]|nr:hypothetical protein [Victivallales bacterium]
MAHSTPIRLTEQTIVPASFALLKMAVPQNLSFNRNAWLVRAETLKPVLKHWRVDAAWAVSPMEDQNAWQGVRLKRTPLQPFLAERSFRTGDTLMVELPETVVGRFRCRLDYADGYADSPARIRVTCGEMPAELTHIDDPFTGILNRAWLPAETITVDDLPAPLEVSRRHSCRYIRLDFIGVPGSLKVRDLHILAEGAEEHLPPPPTHLSPFQRQLHDASVRTLRNCMQTCLEDGPKRDRRLWTGDLRLQAMLNRLTYRRFDLVERCLYLLAANVTANGELPGCVFERPCPRPGCMMHDYALLFAVVLEEHCRWSGNLRVGEDLFELAACQFESLVRFVKDGVFHIPPEEQADFFIDHCPALDKQASMHGLALCSLHALIRLAKRLNRPTANLQKLAKQWHDAARQHFLNPSTGLMESGASRQISCASQVWMILGGALSPEEGLRALHTVEQMPDAIRPTTPYMMHYLLEAYALCGDRQHITELLDAYWGGMLRHGADTFWECYVPTKPLFSPYQDFRLNSSCHAWSATPVCFL